MDNHFPCFNVYVPVVCSLVAVAFSDKTDFATLVEKVNTPRKNILSFYLEVTEKFNFLFSIAKPLETNSSR